MISGLPFLLSVHGLTKRHGNTLILAGVDFDLQPGEILGIIGPNGVRKSTFMEMPGRAAPVKRGCSLFPWCAAANYALT